MDCDFIFKVRKITNKKRAIVFTMTLKFLKLILYFKETSELVVQDRFLD